MRLKNVVSMLLIAVFCLSAGGASAQDDPVRVIPVTSMIARVRLSPDGQTLAVFEDMNAQGNAINLLLMPLRLIDVTTGTERVLLGHTDYATDVVFTPDSTRLISYHANGYIFVWDVTSGQMVKEIPALPGPTRIFMLPDGKTLAVLYSTSVGQILLWDIETGFITAILADRPTTWGQLSDRPAGGTYDRFITLAASPDGTQIATADLTGEISIWDVATGESHLLREGDEEMPRINIRYLQFMPDGDTLMYYDFDDNMAHFWSVTDAVEIRTIVLPEKAHVAVSADGSRIAWISPDDNTLVVADMNQPDNQTVIDLPSTELEYAPFIMPTLFFAANDRLVFSSFLSLGGENQAYVIDLPES